MTAGAKAGKQLRWRRECQEVDATEIRALTERSVDELLSNREVETGRANRRQTIRWPFPGTVELWIPEPRGGERYSLATSVDLSRQGIGVSCEEDLPTGLCLQIAIHEPEMSFHGRAVVRHSTPGEEGGYLLGLQFVFEGE